MTKRARAIVLKSSNVWATPYPYGMSYTSQSFIATVDKRIHYNESKPQQNESNWGQNERKIA